MQLRTVGIPIIAPVNVKKMTIEAVTEIVSENDIVEIEVCTGNGI